MSWSRESSPDPLTRSITNASLVLSSPSKATVASNELHTPTIFRSKSPLPSSASPVKQQQTLIFSTPGKERGSNKAVQASPWRIKVTLEAEPEDARKLQSPRTSKTTTIQVPLRDEDRPRKRRRTSDRAVILDATPAVPDRKRRRPTPGRYKDGGKRSLKPANEGTEVSNPPNGAQQDEAEGGEAVAPAAKRRGRPRKSIDTSARLSGSAPKVSPSKQDSKPARRAGRPKGNVTESDQEVKAKELATPARKSAATAQGKEEDVIVVEPPSSHKPESNSIHIRGTKSIKDRIPTPRRPTGFDESLLSSLPPSSARSVRECKVQEEAISENDEDDATGDRQDSRMVQEVGDNETAMLDCTLAESEGFTMVSIESLRSHHQQSGSKAPVSHDTPISTSTSNAAASHGIGTDVIPTQNIESQKLKSRTPVASGTSTSADASLAMSSAFELGSSSKTSSKLQSDMDVESARFAPTNKPSAIEPSNLRNDGPFDAFHTGTRRQLRAGLAMGELLARSEPGFGAAPKQVQPNASCSAPRAALRANLDLDRTARLPTPADTTENSSSPIHDAALDIQSQAGGHQTASKKDYDDMSWEPTTFVEAKVASARSSDNTNNEPSGKGQERRTGNKTYDEMSSEPTHATAAVQAHGPQDNDSTKNQQLQSKPIDDSTVRRDRTRPVGKYSKSSSSARERVRADDIWLEEAESLLEDSMAEQAERATVAKPAHSVQHNFSGKGTPKRPQETSQDLRDILGEPDDRPARGKIPRTWRRTSGSHFLYSDENLSPVRNTAGPATPLFVRDLRALQEESAEGEEPNHETEFEEHGIVESIHIVNSVERSPSPLKSILSSPYRPRDRRSPSREVRWGRDDVHEFENKSHSQGDERYFSSDDEENESAEEDDAASEHSESYCDADATIYNIDTSTTSMNDGSTALQTTDVRQLRQEFAAVSPGKQNRKRSVVTAQLDTAETGCDDSINTVLSPDLKKQYAPLFGSQSTSNSKIPLTPRRKPLSPTQRRPTPPSQAAREPKRGMFTRLSGWLYPPPPSEPGYVLSATLPKATTGKLYVDKAGKDIDSSTRSQSGSNTKASSTHTKAPAPVLPKSKATVPSKEPTRSSRADTLQAPSSVAEVFAETSRRPMDTSPFKHPVRSPLFKPPKATTTSTPVTPPSIKSGWNRNHYLILQSQYRATFPTPASVIAAAKCLHGTKSKPSTSTNSTAQDTRTTASLLPTLTALLHKSVISSQNGAPDPSQPAMYITPAICGIVHAFTREVSEHGVPLLSNGSLSPPSSRKLAEMGFPMRGTDGRIVRIREDWDEWTVLTKVYGFWVRDVRDASEEADEVNWPVVAANMDERRDRQSFCVD